MTVEVSEHGLIAELVINRPEKNNAFDDALLTNLLKSLKSLKQNTSIRVLILRSRGKHFSAGADLAWMQRMVNYSKSDNLADSQLLADVMYELYHFQKPTIALVQGSAYGGANGLISCCDIAIAARDATFCFPEGKLGLVPAVISPYVIAAIGIRQAKRYFLTAEMMNADVAAKIGLIHEICENHHLDARGLELANMLIQNSPQALITCKSLMNDLHPIGSEVIQKTVETIAEARVSPEGQEGLLAFLEKRKPNWIKS